ncbi:ABC transporter substrate-binding protein [Microbacterium sp. UBA837]|uniref:ABC transporter substrate-binding protein n=1 Tax=Microbacterium sp. UBA837 TaxID=1946956 RepID=UPI0025CC35EF|nr:ABC transporter substrate-binding protein [Microbacterium sp. UBA837]|tara:strand:+ start:1283 stop:2266 length:984 start_codon:yes stop_codon:yes gene_type:complete
MQTNTTGRWPAIAVVSAAVALVLAACSGGGTTDAGAGDDTPEPLTVGLVPVTDAGAFYAAQGLGYFEENGLEVSSETIAGGAALIPALESGAMQTGFGSIDKVIQAGEQGLDIKCLTGTAQGNESVKIMVAPDRADAITTPADLEGRIIAVNALANINQIVAQSWLDENGVDPFSPQFVAVAFPDMLAALEEGRVDAAVVGEPFTTLGIKAGIPVLDENPVAAVGDRVAYSCWIVSGAWLAEHEAEARAFVAALDRAIAYLDENPDYLREILPTYTGLDQEVADTVILPAISSELEPADIDLLQERALQLGIIKSPVDPATLIANLN